MDHRHLEYFHVAALAGSFSQAARELHVTQSALSQGIKLLETRLGRPLFLRGRQLELTEAGEALRPHAARLLALTVEAEEAVRSPAGPLQGTVRVGVLTSALAHVLPVALSQVTREHPGVRIEFDKVAPRRIEDLVRRGEADVGITPRLPDDQALEAEEIGSWPFVVAVPREWRRRRLKTLLKERPLVVLGDWHERDLRDQTDLFDRFPEVQVLHGTNCVVITRALVAEEVGPGVIPAFALGRDLVAHEELAVERLSMYAIRRRRRVSRAAVEAFVAAILGSPLMRTSER